MIRILLVDDQNLIQEGIKALLDQHQDLKVIGTVRDGRSAIKLVDILHPDIVLVDIEMPGMDGITVTKYISCLAPKTKVIILTSYEDKKYVTQALLAGAKGYILKSSLITDLKHAILAVDSGYSQVESRLLAKVFNPNSFKLKKTKSSASTKVNQENSNIDTNSTLCDRENQEQLVENKQNKSTTASIVSSNNKTQTNLNTKELNNSTISNSNYSVSVKSEIQPESIESIESELSELTQQANSLESELSELTQQTNNLELELSEPTQQSESSKLTESEDIENLESESSKLTELEDIENLESASSKLTESEEIENLESELSKLTESEEIENLESELSELTESEDIESLESELSELTESEDIENLESELSELTESEDIENLESELLKQRQQTHLENSESFHVEQKMHSTINKSALVPIINRENSIEKYNKNKLLRIFSAIKKYLKRINYQKNISHYKVQIFKYRLKIHLYIDRKIKQLKSKTSHNRANNNKHQNSINTYKQKIFLLIKKWHKQNLFFNIGLMILGAFLFFVIHSLFS